MNNCVFTGRLTRAPELKQTSSGTDVVNFGIAVNRPYKKADGSRSQETAFLECEAWDTGAKAINQYFKKGDLISIVAEVKQDNWESNGEKRSRLKFRVSRFEFPPTNKREGCAVEDDDAPDDNVDDSGGDDSDDDIPF